MHLGNQWNMAQMLGRRHSGESSVLLAIVAIPEVDQQREVEQQREVLCLSNSDF